MVWVRVALAILGVLGASPAAHAQSPANAFRAETILTEWGTFRCSAIDRAQVPRVGLDVYWMAPTLVITRNHTPLVMRTCDRLRASDLDALWSWMLPPPSGDEADGF